MEIMKIKRKEIVILEVDTEIRLPYFCKSKDGCVFYKVLNEDGHTLRVTNYSFAKSVDCTEIFNERLIFEKSNTEIKKNEFNKALNEVLKALKTSIIK